MLRSQCKPSALHFKTTKDIKPLTKPVGQERAIEAIQFAISVNKAGYNLYALGPHGIGKHSIIKDILSKTKAIHHHLFDWCYVHNFEIPHKPKVLQLPPGLGPILRKDMEQLVESLKKSIPAGLSNKKVQAKIQALENEFDNWKCSQTSALRSKAEKEKITIVNEDDRFKIIPTHEGNELTTSEFNNLPKRQQEKLNVAMKKYRIKLEKIAEKITTQSQALNNKEEDLQKKHTQQIISSSILPLIKKHKAFTDVLSYLNNVQDNIISNCKDFYPATENEKLDPIDITTLKDEISFVRYKVNVLINHQKKDSTPVVYEPNPTYSNLVGRVEHMSQLGALVTNYTLVRPGALHRANGGYLILDIHRLLSHSYAWEGLKINLCTQQITLCPLEQILSVSSTISLEPEPIPLNVKVILLGDHEIHDALSETDPDFKELFKVTADFEEELVRNSKNTQVYAQLIATLINKENLRAFDRSAVAKIIEYSARLVGDAERLTTHCGSLIDLLCEADHWAGQNKKNIVRAADVQKTIDIQAHRRARLRDKLHNEIKRDIIFIDTSGEKIGQINSTPVVQVSDFHFGQPSRITATARKGDSGIIDIEREVDLGGPTHSKGVLILSAFLRSNYAKDKALHLSATLAFEQNYGTVEGDSASLTELCALLSAIAEVPIKQCFAITGSINQLGQVQPVGYINEKIEGFFDICKMRTLTGTQGVLIPEANVKQLMLREDIVAAVAAKQFHVYAVSDVYQALTLLTGITAGEKDASTGEYPKDSVNYLVEKRLKKMSASSHEKEQHHDE